MDPNLTAWDALAKARSYDAWMIAAEAVDALEGSDIWRGTDAHPAYDEALLRAAIVQLDTLRVQERSEELADALTAALYRHQGEVTDESLYGVAMSGTKHLVEQFFESCERAMHWLATEAHDVPREARLERFRLAWRIYGRSALLLSGGATLGFHHLGVVKALFDADLLPRILSGSSTGAMIAAGICARNDDELRDLLDHPAQMRLDGLSGGSPRRFAKTGAWLDPGQLAEVLEHNIGLRTFAEAYAHSGRILNISVSATRSQQKPRLLSHLTSPDVLVASAALASSALPGIFPPVQLQRRRRNGDLAPYMDGETWLDGSLDGDLPKIRLSRLHNANHFIVSQTNPHVLPFMRHRGHRGLRPALYSLVRSTARNQGASATDLVRRATSRSNGPVGMAARQLHNLFIQDYTGDIDVHPQFNWALFKRVMSNPSPQELDDFILEGQRSVWPHLAKIRNETRIGRAFERCIRLLSPR